MHHKNAVFNFNREEFRNYHRNESVFDRNKNSAVFTKLRLALILSFLICSIDLKMHTDHFREKPIQVLPDKCNQELIQ